MAIYLNTIGHFSHFFLALPTDYLSDAFTQSWCSLDCLADPTSDSYLFQPLLMLSILALLAMAAYYYKSL